MAPKQVDGSSWTLTLPGLLYNTLHHHLFPGDGDEHGAVIAAGIARTANGVRLLARDLFLALDGRDYLPSQRAHRTLRAEFVRDCAIYCRDEQLAYLAVHNHGGGTSVDFSVTDMHSHERGYPALLQVTRGQPVGGLVFADQAIAGDIWLPNGTRMELAGATAFGPSVLRLFPRSITARPGSADEYDRQARLFGDVGQHLLGAAKIGVIGAGGAGSLIVQYLSHLGIGHLVVVDPERLDLTNRSRVVGSTRWDNLEWLLRQPDWLGKAAQRLAVPKVAIARRVARRASPKIRFDAIFGDFLDPTVAGQFIDCDFMFLAADSMQARLLFNAIVHQYLVPGVQVGAKVVIDPVSRQVTDVYSVCRPVTPDSGCLWCNGLISASRLQSEALSSDEREAWRYVDDPEVAAPSVITLNGTAVSHAANDFLFGFVGLTHANATGAYMRFRPQTREVFLEEPRSDPSCSECGQSTNSRRARGDAISLPVRQV